jgi:hypothetical protein
LIFLLVWLKKSCIPNVSFLGCLKVLVLQLKTQKKSEELEASLAPAEAEVGAVVKALQEVL